MVGLHVTDCTITSTVQAISDALVFAMCHCHFCSVNNVMVSAIKAMKLSKVQSSQFDI